MKKTFLLVLTLFLAVIVFSQKNYIHYTPTDGLVQTQVTALMQDSKGYIWIGTKAGVSRFDGHTFKNYTTNNGIVGNEVRDVIETDSGEIWILTRQGLHKKAGEKFHHYKPKQSIVTLNAIYDNGTFYLRTSENHKTCVYTFKNGEYAFLKDSVVLINILGKPYFKKYKRNGDIRTVIIYNKKGEFVSKKVYNKNNGFKTIRNNIYFDKIVAIKGGNIEEVASINLGSKPFNSVSNIFLDDNFKTLAMTDHNGRIKIYEPVDLAAKHLHYIEKKEHNYNIYNTSAIIKDDENNIWIGGEQGLYRITPFINYDKESGMPNYVWSIVEDKYNKIWFPTFQKSNLFFYDYDKDKIFEADSSLLEKFYKKDKNDKRTLMFNFYMGAKTLSSGNILLTTRNTPPLLFDGKKMDPLIHDTKISAGFMIYEDTVSGVVYYSERYSLYEIINNKLEKIDVYNERKYGVVSDIERGNDNKIYLVSLKGISVYDPNKNSLQFISNDSLPMAGNISICKDYKGNLWIGSVNGLFLYNYKTFKQINHPELNNLLTSLEVLKGNTLIAGSIRGIAMLDLKSFYEENDSTLRFYAKSSGFYGGEVAQNCITQDSRGNVWVATSTNVVRFDPTKLTKSKQTPKLYIEKVSAFDNEFNYVELSDSITAVTNEYENITIQFTGIYHKAPEQVYYKWQLVGYETAISPMAKKREVTYTNLHPGKYTFKLWACNESGKWSEKPNEYKFEIVPAFWQTKAFIIVASIFIILLVIFVSTYFVKRKHKINLIKKEQEIAIVKSKLKGQEQEKQRISRELHDGIGGELTGIKMQIEQKANKIPELLTISQSIGKLNKELRSLSHDLARPSFSGNDFSNTVKSYINRVKQDNLEINFDVYNLNAEKLDPSLLYAFYRIIQEAIGNILKHSEASEVFIQITQSETEINLIVEDNGIGFDKEKLAEGIGLRNIKSRVHALNGEINIETALGKGVLISITSPLLST